MEIDRCANRRARAYRAASLLWLAVLLATWLTPFSPAIAEAPSPKRASGSAASVDLIPRDSKLVISGEVTALRKWPSLLRARSRIPFFIGTWRRLESFLAATGLDLGRDVEFVTIGAKQDGPRRGESVLVARGRFDPSAVTGSLSKRGWLSDPRMGDGKILIAPSAASEIAGEPGSRGSPTQGSSRRAARNTAGEAADPLACHISPSGWILWGERSWVLRSMALQSGSGASVLTDPVMSRLISSASEKGQAWMAIGSPALARQAIRRLLPDTASGAVDTIAAVDSLTISVRGGSDVAIHGETDSGDEGQAGILADSLRAAIALAKLGVTETDPAALAALRTVRVEQDGRTVMVNGQIPESLIRRQNP